MLVFKGNDLWQGKIVEAKAAPKMKFLLKKKGGSIPGFGIYAISYKSDQFGDRIVYIGKYAGSKSKNTDDAKAGDVRERWFKHFGTATLLLRDLKMASSKSYYYHRNKSNLFFLSDELFKKCVENSFLSINEEMLNKSIFIKGADMQISNNRMGFAIQNLKETNTPDIDNDIDLSQLLSKFTYYYWQIQTSSDVKKSSINKLLTGSMKTGGCEFDVLSRYKQKLPMNNEYLAKTNLHDQFYHYDPNELIETSSDEFKDLQSFIINKIKQYIPHAGIAANLL